MPHFIVEYSAGLETRYEMQAVADLVRDTAAKTGIFPLSGIRVRLYPAAICAVADGHEDNAFVSVLARIGAGREQDVRKKAGQAIFDALCSHFRGELDTGHFLISLDMAENDPTVSFKKNTIRGRLGA